MVYGDDLHEATALAAHLARAGHEVLLWARDAEVLRAIEQEKKNPRYLPQVRLPETLRAEADLNLLCREKDALVYAVPTHATRELAKLTAPSVAPQALIVSTAKGFEEASFLRGIGLCAYFRPSNILIDCPSANGCELDGAIESAMLQR